jgi:hypothetical protein
MSRLLSEDGKSLIHFHLSRNRRPSDPGRPVGEGRPGAPRPQIGRDDFEHLLPLVARRRGSDHAAVDGVLLTGIRDTNVTRKDG